MGPAAAGGGARPAAWACGAASAPGGPKGNARRQEAGGFREGGAAEGGEEDAGLCQEGGATCESHQGSEGRQEDDIGEGCAEGAIGESSEEGGQEGGKEGRWREEVHQEAGRRREAMTALPQPSDVLPHRPPFLFVSEVQAVEP